MFGFKKPKSQKPPERIVPFPPNAQNNSDDFYFGGIPPIFGFGGPATVIVGADADIPPEVVAEIVQALSEIPPSLIEQMLDQVIGGAGSDVFRFSASDLSKGQIIEIGEDSYTIIPDANEQK